MGDLQSKNKLMGFLLRENYLKRKGEKEISVFRVNLAQLFFKSLLRSLTKDLLYSHTVKWQEAIFILT